MPSGLPSAVDLMQKKVAAFSLDTQTFESKGYRFKEGDLSVLQNQLPPWLKLKLTDIVTREVLNHRIKRADEANQALRSAISNLHRHTGLDVNCITNEHAALNIDQVLRKNFEAQMNDFVSELNGEVLQFDNGLLAQEMFRRYFLAESPFGHKKERKSEFPDAAALLTLERTARLNKEYTILVSDDNCWHDFAAKSDWLYCVKTLDELTKLFESKIPEASQIAAKIQAELLNFHSDLFKQVSKKIASDLPDMDWDANEAYTGFSSRLEAEVISVDVLSIQTPVQDSQWWFAEHDPSVCVMEVTFDVEVNVEISAEFLSWDSIDQDEFNIGTGAATVRQTVGVKVYMEFSGNLVDTQVAEWDVNIELAFSSFSADAIEMEPDYSEQ
jgi:PIN domain